MELDKTEIWRPLLGYEGLYEISNLGEVKSLPRAVRSVGSAKKEYLIHRKEKILSKIIDSNGYIQVTLTKNKISKLTLVHRIIALAFIPNPENKRCVNHKNGIKTDNRVENLEWMTHSENSKHSFQIGLQCNKGENHPSSKLTTKDVLLMRKLKSEGKSSYSLAKMFGITYTTAKEIIKRKTWQHI